MSAAEPDLHSRQVFVDFTFRICYEQLNTKLAKTKSWKHVIIYKRDPELN